MKKVALLATLAVFAFAAAPAHAALKTYQVTGPVTAMEPGKITVQKGNDKWEIGQGSVAIPAGVQVGSKVTIEYTMTADTITSKDTVSASTTAAKPKKDKAAK